MNRLTRLIAAFTAALATLGASASADPQHLPTAQPVLEVPAPASLPVPAKPALWKIADHDTTIYLFGTIHILPDGIDWMNGPVAYAFDHSDLLVTELPDLPQSDVVSGILRYGVLPAGQSLRSKMGDERRGRFEAALDSLGQSKAMFDRNQAWVPALLLPLLAIQKHGFDPRHGVEATLEARNKGLNRPRIGLETLDFQFRLFASIDEERQLDYLDSVVMALPDTEKDILALVEAWKHGNTAELARQFQDDLGDAELSEALAYSRNRSWTRWIEARMKQPGSVFIAVGAGHLVGKKSVNDLLAHDGYQVTRVQ